VETAVRSNADRKQETQRATKISQKRDPLLAKGFGAGEEEDTSLYGTTSSRVEGTSSDGATGSSLEGARPVTLTVTEEAEEAEEAEELSAFAEVAILGGSGEIEEGGRG
jgi:hypothetical protein